MKSVLALATVALVALILEEKARQVAGDAQHAYGEAVDQARSATETLSQQVKRQPFPALFTAGGLGFVLARLTPRR